MVQVTLILRPALVSVISMAVIGTPFLALGAWVAVEMIRTGDRDVVTALSSAGVIVLGLWLWLEVTTVRIFLTPETLHLQRYWHTRWSVGREKAVLTPGAVGDGGFLPGLRVYETGKTGHIGEILYAQFRPADLIRLRQALSGDQT